MWFYPLLIASVSLSASLIRRLPFTIQELDCGALSFYNSKNLNCFGAVFFIIQKNLNCIEALSFFKDLFTPFLDFNLSCFFGHAEISSGSKKESEIGVCTKFRFLASGFSLTCGNFTLIFNVFFHFLIRFFLNGLPFHSQSILGLFVGTDLSFLASVYLSIWGILTYFFYFLI